MTSAPSARVIEDIVRAACRAPSVHNTQPWQWRYDGQSLDLYADWSRQVRLGDPDRRDLVISCGAALHHAVTAAAGLGLRADVRRLSDPEDHRHLATMTFREPAGPSAVELAAAIDRRRTDRRTPSSVPVPEHHLEDLVRIGAERGAFVIPLRDQEHASLVGDLRQLAALVQQDDDLYLAELAGWTHSRGTDGVPDEAVLAQTGGTSRFSSSTRFPPGALADEQSADADSAPSWLVVAASSDDTLSRLRVGEALSAMLLRATLLDLAVVPYTQAVAVDPTRHKLEERLLGGGRSLQLILRAGVLTPGRKPIPTTRRRPVQDVLTLTWT